MEGRGGCEDSKALILGGKGHLVYMMTGPLDIEAVIISSKLGTKGSHETQRQWSLDASVGTGGGCERGSAAIRLEGFGTDSSSFAGSGRAGKHARTGDISVPEELLAEVRGEVFFGVCCRPMNWEGAKLSERTDRDRYWTLLLKGVAFVQGNACKETEANTERAKTRTRRGGERYCPSNAAEMTCGVR